MVLLKCEHTKKNMITGIQGNGYGLCICTGQQLRPMQCMYSSLHVDQNIEMKIMPQIYSPKNICQNI